MKKKLVLLGAALLSTVAVTTVSLKSNDINNVIKAENEDPYTLSINAPLYTGNSESGEGYTYVQTALGNNIKIKYYKLSKYASGINKVVNDSYIEIVSNNDIKGLTGITGVTITRVVNKDNCYLNVGYGWEEGTMINSIQQVAMYNQPSNTFDIPNSPSYIRIYPSQFSYSCDVDLQEIVITYSCKTTEDPYVEGDYSFVLNDDHFEVSRYRGSGTDLSIPGEYAGHTVTAIADDFVVDMGKDKITSVTLPASITRLGRNAFSGAENMITINVSNITDYDYRALFNCKKLCDGQALTINATHIGANAISQTGIGILNISSPTDEISIDADAFSNNDDMVRVFFDRDVVLRAGSTLFRSCDQMYLIYLPVSINTLYEDNCLEESTFNGCSGLTNIYYRGTAEQWNNISKLDSWHKDVPATVVHCNNGEDVDI